MHACLVAAAYNLAAHPPSAYHLILLTVTSPFQPLSEFGWRGGLANVWRATELWRCATAEGAREIVDEALNVRLQGVLVENRGRLRWATVSV